MAKGSVGLSCVVIVIWIQDFYRIGHGDVPLNFSSMALL